MKVLSTTGLTKLVQLIKSNCVSNSDVESVSTIGFDNVPTAGSNNLVTSGVVKSALDNVASVSGKKLII